MNKYEVISRGQPRAYADHELVVNVELPGIDDAEQAKDEIEAMQIGFTRLKHGNFWESTLDYLILVDGGRDLWQFKVRTPYMG